MQSFFLKDRCSRPPRKRQTARRGEGWKDAGRRVHWRTKKTGTYIIKHCSYHVIRVRKSTREAVIATSVQLPRKSNDIQESAIISLHRVRKPAKSQLPPRSQDQKEKRIRLMWRRRETARAKARGLRQKVLGVTCRPLNPFRRFTACHSVQSKH